MSRSGMIFFVVGLLTVFCTSFCTADNFRNSGLETETIEGRVSAIDPTSSMITIDTADYEEDMSFAVAPKAKIYKDDRPVPFYKINIDDEISMEYYDTSANQLTASTITVTSSR